MHVPSQCAVILVVLSAEFCLQGCASIMHGASQDIAIETTPPGAVATIEDTKGRSRDSLTTPGTATLSRKREYYFTIRKSGYELAGFFLKQTTSRWYYSNVLFWSVPGLIVDHVDGARYSLNPQRINVVLTESPGPHVPSGEGAVDYNKVPLFRPAQAIPWSHDARVRLAFSIPEGNWFYYDSPEKLINRFGFLGLILGLEYFPKPGYFYSAKLGVTTDFMLPFPVPVDYCIYEGVGEALVQIQVNRERPKYVVGAGIHWLSTGFRRYVMGYCVEEPPEIEDQDIRFQSYGLSASVQRRLSDHTYVAIDYLPSILQNQAGRYIWEYSHTVFLSVTYKATLARF